MFLLFRWMVIILHIIFEKKKAATEQQNKKLAPLDKKGDKKIMCKHYNLTYVLINICLLCVSICISLAWDIVVIVGK
jgi:hypothetical protein